MIPRAVPTLFDPSHDPGMLHEYHLANFTRAAYPPRRPHISHRLTACGTTRQPADSTDTDRPIACLGCLVLPWEFGYLAGFLDLISNQREILPTPEFLS